MWMTQNPVSNDNLLKSWIFKITKKNFSKFIWKDVQYTTSTKKTGLHEIDKILFVGRGFSNNCKTHKTYIMVYSLSFSQHWTINENVSMFLFCEFNQLM